MSVYGPLTFERLQVPQFVHEGLRIAERRLAEDDRTRRLRKLWRLMPKARSLKPIREATGFTLSEVRQVVHDGEGRPRKLPVTQLEVTMLRGSKPIRLDDEGRIHQGGRLYRRLLDFGFTHDEIVASFAEASWEVERLPAEP